MHIASLCPANSMGERCYVQRPIFRKDRHAKCGVLGEIDPDQHIRRTKHTEMTSYLFMQYLPCRPYAQIFCLSSYIAARKYAPRSVNRGTRKRGGRPSVSVAVTLKRHGYIKLGSSIPRFLSKLMVSFSLIHLTFDNIAQNMMCTYESMVRC